MTPQQLSKWINAQFFWQDNDYTFDKKQPELEIYIHLASFQ